MTCALPTTFKWASAGPLATPQAPAGKTWVALKDFSDVVYNHMHIVYMSTHDTATSYGSAMFMFGNWPDASKATQLATPHGVAPTLFYFTPKNIWVLAYQWGSTAFSYVTSSDPTNPTSWSSEKSLFAGTIADGGSQHRADRPDGDLQQHHLLSVLRRGQREHLPVVDADRQLPGYLRRADDGHVRHHRQPVRGGGGLHDRGRRAST